MSRVGRAWRALDRERRIAAVAAVALLVTMFLPWYGLQSLNRKSGAIYSHSINAFGDVSFVEAAIFLVAAGVMAMLFARAEERDFALPGGDGTIVALAGAWAGLLIFYRVFSRPAGNGYPVGIEWGFFLAFVATGCLAYAGWRMRAAERPPPPLRRHGGPRAPTGEQSYGREEANRPARRDAEQDRDPGVPGRPQRSLESPRRSVEPAGRSDELPRRAVEPAGRSDEPGRRSEPADRGDEPTVERPPRSEQDTVLVPASPRPRSGTPGRTRQGRGGRDRYPPAPPEPPEQLSFEDPPTRAE